MYIIQDRISNEYYLKHKLDSEVIWTKDKNKAYTFPTISDCMRYMKLTMAGIKNLYIVRLDNKDPYKAYEKAMKGI